MQRGPEPDARPVAIVLGCDEIGSAVAHRLHCDGFAVVLIDGVDPPWPRRGMAFTDAWYAGVAELSGVSAVFCASVRSIPAVLDRSVAGRRDDVVVGRCGIGAVAGRDDRDPRAVRAPHVDRSHGRHHRCSRSRSSPARSPGRSSTSRSACPPPQPVRERVLYAPCAGRFSTQPLDRRARSRGRDHRQRRRRADRGADRRLPARAFRARRAASRRRASWSRSIRVPTRRVASGSTSGRTRSRAAFPRRWKASDPRGERSRASVDVTAVP